MIKAAFAHRAVYCSAVATAIWLLAVTATNAHAKLISTTPEADQTVPSPQLIKVHFNSAIAVKLSALRLVGSNGDAVSTMSMNDAKDASTLSVMPSAKLKPGVYKVSWHVVSEDGHKEQGAFSFTVQ